MGAHYVTTPMHDLEARARWHLAIGYPTPEEEAQARAEEALAMLECDSDTDDGLCFDCGQIHDVCECHVGEECGRWRNGALTSHCLKAGSEECDFECPYRGSLRF